MKILQNSLMLSVFITASAFAVEPPSVMFTNTPIKGETTGRVNGYVRGVNTTEYGIAFFINYYGTWWTKPRADRPILPINSDQTFEINPWSSCGTDIYADTFAAFVVPLTYSNSIPIVLGPLKIPAEIYSNSIAHIIYDRRTANDFINFAGYRWEKKVTIDDTYNWGGTFDPGGNWWGQGPGNISVDSNGKLHLSVFYTNNFWSCSEVISYDSFGYGLYRFRVETNMSNFPARIILGMFTYSDDPGINNAHREIDFEFSNGAVVGEGTSNNWQNVIQPWNTAGNRMRFPAPPNMDKSVHEFLWTSNSVSFNNFSEYSNDIINCQIISAPTVSFNNSVNRGLYQGTSKINTSANITYQEGLPDSQFFKANFVSLTGNPAPFYKHTFTNGIPQADQEKVHLNLWLHNGWSDGLIPGQKYEVIISDFEFIPINIGNKRNWQ